jgi:internalin A
MTSRRSSIPALLVCACCTLLLASARSQDDDEAVRAWVKTLGSGVQANGQPITSMSLAHSQVADEDLKRIAGLKHLEWLSLGQTKVTDAGLKELAGLTKLEILILERTKVTDTGLKELARLKSLQSLYLGGTQVTDAGMRELIVLPDLQELDLHDTQVTGACLKDVHGIKSLRSLRLEGSKLMDAGMNELASLKRLKSLNLKRSEITDGVLRRLREAGLLQALIEAETGEMPSNDSSPQAVAARRPARPADIGVLNLSFSGVTDAGLKELAALIGLRYLNLLGTKVEGTGMKDLAGLERLNCVVLSSEQVTDGTLRTLREAGLLHALGLAAIDPNKHNQGNNAVEKTVTTPGPPKSDRPARPEDVFSLDLAASKVTDAGLQELAAFKNLDRLFMQSTHVTGDGFQALAGLTKLKYLALDESSVTDAGLRGLAGLTSLEHLGLRSTLITDAGLKELRGLKRLKQLVVAGTRVTDAGLKEYAGIKNGPAVHEIKPDQLLTTAQGAPSGYQIFLVNADGSGRTQLTVGERGAGDPARSPLGKRIAMVVDACLCVSNADGSERQPIAERADIATLAPTWSSDGKAIAFSLQYRGVPAGTFHWRMYVVDADGQNLRPLGDVDDLLPAWSPDGQRLLFTRIRRAPGLWVMDKSGTNARELVKGALAGTWSPDGRSVAYVVIEGDRAGLYVARADGSEPRRLRGADEAHVILGPAQWAPDGKRLFFTQMAKKAAAVYVIDVDGRNGRRITPGNTQEYLGGTFVLAHIFFR